MKLYRVILLGALGGAFVAGIAWTADDPAPQLQAKAPNYAVDWFSVSNGGATDAISASYRMGVTIADPAAGEAMSTSYRMGFGFWQGAAVPPACYCGLLGKLWADVSDDGAVNPVDVVRLVNFVYKNQTSALIYPSGGPWTCPNPLGDANLDGLVNPVDVVRYVNYVYKNQTTQVSDNPCGP